MDANSGGIDTDTAGMVMPRTEDGAWYEWQRLDAERAAALAA
jgi:hypothetical protein